MCDFMTQTLMFLDAVRFPFRMVTSRHRLSKLQIITYPTPKLRPSRIHRHPSLTKTQLRRRRGRGQLVRTHTHVDRSARARAYQPQRTYADAPRDFSSVHTQIPNDDGSTRLMDDIDSDIGLHLSDGAASVLHLFYQGRHGFGRMMWLKRNHWLAFTVTHRLSFSHVLNHSEGSVLTLAVFHATLLARCSLMASRTISATDTYLPLDFLTTSSISR